jgi:hypothetical protein
MEVFKGRIVAFGGSWGSGLGTLVIDDEKRGRVSILCENGATVRALDAAFCNVIGDAHDVKTDGGHVGQGIYYSTDDFGILEAFTPVDDAPPELVRIYEEAIP